MFRSVLRRVVILVLTAAAVVVAFIWSWCKYWEGVIGGWSIRLGDFALSHTSYNFCDLSLSIGTTPDTAWRATRFARVDGFGYAIGPNYASLSAPFWFVFVLLATYPSWSLVRWYINERRTQERMVEGRCVTCGYNFTGLTEPRCPECSTEIPAPTLSMRRVRLCRLAELFAFFLCLGIGWGTLTAIVIEATRVPSLASSPFFPSPFFSWADWVGAWFGGFPSIFGWGAAMGLLWCTFGVPLLFRKPNRRIAAPLTATVCTTCFIVAITAVLYPPLGQFLIIPAPTTVALLTCIMLRRTTPDAPPRRRIPSADAEISHGA